MTGNYNSLFGAGAGQNVTSGFDNTTMGNVAGSGITTGAHNTFIGGDTGNSITVETQNSLLGAESNVAPGVSNSTAIGANAYVTASNSLVLGSVANVNGAAGYSINVGIGVTAPNCTLQVGGSISLPIKTVANSSLAAWNSLDYVIVITGTTTTLCALPNPVAGRVCVLKNSTTKTATVEPLQGTALVDGNASEAVAAGANAQYICDGTNWYKIN